MSESLTNNPDLEAIKKDNLLVGQVVRQAMVEIARENGNEELAAEVIANFSKEELLPDAASLKILIERIPGAAELVGARANKIQDETHQAEVEELNQTAKRRGNFITRLFK